MGFLKFEYVNFNAALQVPYRPLCLPVAEEYEGKNKVKVKAMGSGAGLSEHISDDEVIFGGLRTKEGKFLCLMCASFLQGVFSFLVEIVWNHCGRPG